VNPTAGPKSSEEVKSGALPPLPHTSYSFACGFFIVAVSQRRMTGRVPEEAVRRD
jgi:hypothetical protein